MLIYLITIFIFRSLCAMEETVQKKSEYILFELKNNHGRFQVHALKKKYADQSRTFSNLLEDFDNMHEQIDTVSVPLDVITSEQFKLIHPLFEASYNLAQANKKNEAIENYTAAVQTAAHESCKQNNSSLIELFNILHFLEMYIISNIIIKMCLPLLTSKEQYKAFELSKNKVTYTPRNFDHHITKQITYKLLQLPLLYIAYKKNVWTQPHAFDGHNSKISTLTFSNDNASLASGSKGSLIRIWDHEKRVQKSKLTKHTDSINHMFFSTDDKKLFSASNDSNVCIWDLNTNHAIDILSEHTAPVTCIGMHPNQYELATSSKDSTVKIWDIRNTKKTVKTYKGNKYPKNWVTYSKNGTSVVIGSDHDDISTWNTKDHTWKQQILLNEGGNIHKIFCLDEETYLVQTNKSIVALKKNGNKINHKKIYSKSDVADILISPEKKIALIGKKNGQLFTKNLYTNKDSALFQGALEYGTTLHSLALSAEGTRIGYGLTNGFVVTQKIESYYKTSYDELTYSQALLAHKAYKKDGIVICGCTNTEFKPFYNQHFTEKQKELLKPLIHSNCKTCSLLNKFKTINPLSKN